MINERSQDESSEVDASGSSHRSTAIPQQISVDINTDVYLPQDRFWVRDANGDDAQVRLEPNGNVYICYTLGHRRVIESREISWDKFLSVFRTFVNSVRQ
jgi:hypothetical protein